MLQQTNALAKRDPKGDPKGNPKGDKKGDKKGFFLEKMQMFNANKQNCNKLTECMFYPIHPNVQSLLF